MWNDLCSEHEGMQPAQYGSCSKRAIVGKYKMEYKDRREEGVGFIWLSAQKDKRCKHVS
jgi:hypothetical protein